MDERRRVNQLQGYRHMLQLLQIVGPEFPAEQNENRAQPFTSRLQQVQRRFAQQLLIAFDAPVQLPLNKIHIPFQRAENIH
ncbi:hypothetical protein D1872_225630 [compost metagenome]